MPTGKKRLSRREQQAKEVEENHEALRNSILETQKLIEEAEAINRRHRTELDDDDAERAPPDLGQGAKKSVQKLP